MNIYSRKADPILNFATNTSRTFFWLRFFLFNFPSFWNTFAMKTELIVYFPSVTKQMNIYSRKADRILNSATNTSRTFFWLSFFLFNFPSFWNTFAMKTELIVYFPSVTNQMNIYSRKADLILNLATNTSRTFFWLRFFLLNFPSFWNTFAMKTDMVVYFPSLTKQLTKETNSSINFSIWMV